MEMSPESVVALAFVIFVVALYRPIARYLTKTLDARASRIAEELAEAQRLREEAQATLLAYQKRQQEVNQEAEAILLAAKKTAERLQEEARGQLQKAVEARVAQANDKIAQEEKKAVAEVHRRMIDIANFAAKTLLSEEYKEQADDQLMNLALKDASRVLH